jgi:hypothetical protein
MSEKFYESIEDMPLYNWNKCMSGDYYYVRVDEKQLDLPSCEKAFKKLYDSYFEIFGIDKKYKEQIEVIKKIALLQCDYLITRDEFKITQIEVENAKLEMVKTGISSNVTLQTTLIYLSKWIGYRLDWKQVTVYEYYTLLEESSKQAKNG